MTAPRGSVRRAVPIARPAAAVWEVVGDPSRVAEWFPGIVSASVDGDQRVVTLGSGLSLPEQLLTVDPLQRRFQYRITAPIVREHLSTIDVYDLGDGTSLTTYAADADPAMFALIIGGAGGNALAYLRDRLEGEHRQEGES